jgi:hypothetical protein
LPDAATVGALLRAQAGLGCDRAPEVERLLSARTGFALGVCDGLTVTGGKG